MKVGRARKIVAGPTVSTVRARLSLPQAHSLAIRNPSSRMHILPGRQKSRNWRVVFTRSQLVTDRWWRCLDRQVSDSRISLAELLLPCGHSMGAGLQSSRVMLRPAAGQRSRAASPAVSKAAPISFRPSEKCAQPSKCTGTISAF